MVELALIEMPVFFLPFFRIEGIGVVAAPLVQMVMDVVIDLMCKGDKVLVEVVGRVIDRVIDRVIGRVIGWVVGQVIDRDFRQVNVGRFVLGVVDKIEGTIPDNATELVAFGIERNGEMGRKVGGCHVVKARDEGIQDNRRHIIEIACSSKDGVVDGHGDPSGNR